MSSFQFKPVTPHIWGGFETVMGPRGGTGGCWCMYLRLSHAEFESRKGEPNHVEMKAIVDSGEIPGILAYVDGQPAGWCSIAPREAFPRLQQSRVAKRIGDQPVWSVICFFIHKDYRRSGVSSQLLEASVDYAKGQGAKIVEGYPVEPKKDNLPKSSSVLVSGKLPAARKHAPLCAIK